MYKCWMSNNKRFVYKNSPSLIINTGHIVPVSHVQILQSYTSFIVQYTSPVSSEVTHFSLACKSFLWEVYHF